MKSSKIIAGIPVYLEYRDGAGRYEASTEIKISDNPLLGSVEYWAFGKSRSDALFRLEIKLHAVARTLLALSKWDAHTRVLAIKQGLYDQHLGLPTSEAESEAPTVAW